MITKVVLTTHLKVPSYYIWESTPSRGIRHQGTKLAGPLATRTWVARGLIDRVVLRMKSIPLPISGMGYFDTVLP